MMFFVLIASCSTDKDTKVELQGNNIEKTNNLVNQPKNNINESLIIEESDSEDIVIDSSQPIILAQSNLPVPVSTPERSSLKSRKVNQGGLPPRVTGRFNRPGS